MNKEEQPKTGDTQASDGVSSGEMIANLLVTIVGLTIMLSENWKFAIGLALFAGAWIWACSINERRKTKA